jgi:hypothetical protein
VNLSTTHRALNRPSPDEVKADDRCGVMVLTGEGTVFSAGIDIKEYFRDMKDERRIVNIKVRRLNWEWQWRRLRYLETDDCDGEWLVLWWSFPASGVLRSCHRCRGRAIRLVRNKRVTS